MAYVVGFSQSPALPSYDADPKIQLHDLRNYTSVFVDSFNSVSTNDIISGKHDAIFLPYGSATKVVKPFTTYWLKVTVNPLANFDDWWIILRDTGKLNKDGSANDLVDVYTNNGNVLVAHQRSGPLVPASQKTVPGYVAMGCVKFSALTAQPLTLYIKLYNEKYPPKQLFYPQLQNPVIPIVIPHGGLDILSAIALLFSVLSFFFFFFVREKAYLFFALYTLVLSQHYLILDPNLPFVAIFIPEHPQLLAGFWRLFTVGSFILFCFFGQAFINLRVLAPKTDKWFRIFLMVFSGLLFIDSASLMITQKNVFPDLLFFCGFPVILGFFIRFIFLRSVLAKLYVGGALWLLIFSALGLVWENGVLNLPFNPWPVGQVGQLLIYAAALAYKIRLNEQARAEALRIHEMDAIKSKFFANISHEFRTPLTLIQGPLQQIEEQVASNEQQNGTVPVPWRQIKTMRRNTDRLLELVNQLLDLSKLDAGNMKLQIARGDVLQLLKSLAASFDSMAERKQIHYHIHFPEQSSIAFFDKDKLEKIFTNVLANAFKYTPEQGTVSVNVIIEENRLRLSVEDNGPGIAKKELDKVFDRFYQVEGTGDKGSGIGLALVKELVDLYRGQISVSSEPGKGSRFRISLPMEKKAFRENEIIYGEYKSEAVFINRSTEAGYEINGNGKLNSHLPLLLIVEDNTDLRAFIRETVEQYYQVEEAVNGKEGLERSIALVPDIIVSDVMMPVMDGFAMTEKLKKDERSSHIPVILLTAKAGQQHKIEGLETGADDYLTKPFDAKELLARIENLVHQRKLLRKKFAGTIQLKPSEVSVKSLDEVFLSNTMKAIEKNIGEEDFGVEELAKQVLMSRSQLHRKLVALIDKSPSDLIRQTRLLRAKELLQKKASTPSEVAFKVGFNSHTYFSKCFKEEFGISPSEIV